jgi:hypothetical protein
MKKLIIKIFGTSYRTSILGVVAILFGLWLMRVHYVPNQTLYFNVVYVWPVEFGIILAGWGLLHSCDHKDK